MIHELRIPLPVVTPKGSGLAYFLLDYHLEHHLFWICFLDETGECWTFSNPDIRIQNNPSIGRNANHPCKAVLHPNNIRLKDT